MSTPYSEDAGSISPDGRWMAYPSDESGRFEIYVQSFPTPRTKYRVTSEGGVGRVWWRADGKELFTLSADARKVFVVDVQAGEEFRSDTPRVLMTLPRATAAIGATRDFQRFLVSAPIDENAGFSLTVILDWTAALRRN